MHRLTFELYSPVTVELDRNSSLVRTAFLGFVQNLCPDLATYLHDVENVKPYALTPLSPHRSDFTVFLREAHKYGFSVTLLREEDLSTILEGLVQKPDMQVRLHAYDLPISSIAMDYVSVEKLSDNMDGMPDDFRLQFLSPTYFREYGTGINYMFPDPVKIFPNTLRTWNAFSSTGKCEKTGEYYEWVKNNIYPTGYRLETLLVPLTKGRKVVGFLGFCNYHCKDPKSPYAKLTYALCRFAEYANVGGNRSAGFGVVKFVPKEKKIEEIKGDQKGGSGS